MAVISIVLRSVLGHASVVDWSTSLTVFLRSNSPDDEASSFKLLVVGLETRSHGSRARSDHFTFKLSPVGRSDEPSRVVVMASVGSISLGRLITTILPSSSREFHTKSFHRTCARWLWRSKSALEGR